MFITNKILYNILYIKLLENRKTAFETHTKMPNANIHNYTVKLPSATTLAMKGYLSE